MNVTVPFNTVVPFDDVSVTALAVSTAVYDQSAVVLPTLPWALCTCTVTEPVIAADADTPGALTCPTCARSFFLPRAGRSLDDDGLQLAPVPLLRENGGVRVALSQ